MRISSPLSGLVHEFGQARFGLGYVDVAVGPAHRVGPRIAPRRLALLLSTSRRSPIGRRARATNEAFLVVRTDHHTLRRSRERFQLLLLNSLAILQRSTRLRQCNNRRIRTHAP